VKEGAGSHGGAGGSAPVHPAPGRPPACASGAWLISERADFWVASAGGGALLVVMGLLLVWHGDRELDFADLLLSELHLGATYDAIVRRRLWRRMLLYLGAYVLGVWTASFVLVLAVHHEVQYLYAIGLAVDRAAPDLRRRGFRRPATCALGSCATG
jgi:hypothetical protein